MNVFAPTLARSQRWVSLFWAGRVTRREVFVGDLVGVDEAAVAELPDRGAAAAGRQHDPPLGGVALRRAGDETEVVGRVLVGVEEPAVALLADHVDGSDRRQFPALGVVVLGWAGDQAEVFVGDLVGVQEPAVALLANGVRAGRQHAHRVELADPAEVVGGQRPLRRVRRDRGEHHRSRDIGVLQTEDVAELVQRNRLDVEAAGDCPDDPLVFGVVEVNRLGQGVGDHATGWREVGVGEHATDHRVIGVVGRSPVDDDVGVLGRRGLGEDDGYRGRPRGERVAHRLELGAAADVVRPVLEGEGEVRVRPGATGGERDAVVEIRHAAPVRRHLLPGRARRTHRSPAGRCTPGSGPTPLPSARRAGSR